MTEPARSPSNTAPTGTVCVVGSVNIDLVTRLVALPRPGQTVFGESLTRLPGGKGANQAVAAARAGAGSRLVGRVGEDGADYLAGLAARGVDCAATTTVPGIATGHAMIAVDQHGENTIIVIPGANAELTPDDVRRQRGAIEGADVLLLQLEIPLDTVRRAAGLANEAGVRVLLNASPWTELPEDLLAVADPLIVNEHEAAGLAGSAAKSVCVTLGDRGARWGELTVPAVRAEVVDTTGAGDAFAGALAAALAGGDDPADALRRAVTAGAETCSWPGAQGWTLP